MIIDIVNYVAFLVLVGGLVSILRQNFKARDILFLSGTSLLTLGALLSWLEIGSLEVFAFILLFLLQVIANILQIALPHESLRTTMLFLFSAALFAFFFWAGLFESSTFFLIALGTIIAGFAYKERPEHVVRQAALLTIAAVFEILFAWLTLQYFYVILNVMFIVFTALIIRKNLKPALA